MMTLSAETRMDTQVGSQPRTPFVPLIVAALLCASQLALTFPGQLVFDSAQQLSEAMSQHYGDWHPPIMAVVWSHLIAITGDRGSLLVLHQTLHWLGFGLIADGCYRANMVKRSWVILAAGAFPLFVIFDRVVWKDVGMGSAFVAAVGVAFWFLIQKRAIPWWAYLMSGACLLYGGLIRTNAVFALGPLVYIYATRGRQFSFAKIMGCSILVAAIAIPLSDWINHRIIGARPQDPLQSLQIFDLMGIAVHAGDNRVWGENAPDLSSMQNCYSAYWWDTLSPWGICPELRRQIGAAPDIDTIDPDHIRLRNQLWRSAILHHPLAYAAHRLSHFNASIYFLVPALQVRYAKRSDAALTAGPFTQRDIELDYLKRSFLLWPVFWLAVGLCGLVIIRVPTQPPETLAVAKSLMLSGLLYSASYLLFGVATEYRYYYWSIMAILLGVILAADEIPKLFIDRPWRGGLAATLVLAVVIGGYAARVANLRLF
jgi:hypothetical protein